MRRDARSDDDGDRFDPYGLPPDGGPGPWRGVLRWLVAAGLASALTLAMFAVMGSAVDGAWILEKLIRIFPLTVTELSPEDECALGSAAVVIEGSVGHYAGGDFVPRGDAEMRLYDGIADGRVLALGSDGSFRFATAFPDASPSACRGEPGSPGGTTPHLVIRAPGCSERRVPVPRAWVPHRVLLTCAPPE